MEHEPAIGHNDPPAVDAVERAHQALSDYVIGVAHEKEGRGSALAAIIAHGLALREGRVKFKSNNAFWGWIKDNQLDQVKPFDQQQERNAAMKIAEISSTGTPADAFSDCPYSRPTDVMKWWRRKTPKPKPEADALGAEDEAAIQLGKAQERQVAARLKCSGGA